MTIKDYHLVMAKVGIAELKAKLSQYLRLVRRGDSLTVVDRQSPVARIIPYSGGSELLTVRPPTAGVSKPADVPLPPPVRLGLDVVELLLDDRAGDR